MFLPLPCLVTATAIVTLALEGCGSIDYEETHTQLSTLEVVEEWVQMDYEWKSELARAEAIKSGEFDPKHNTLTGLKLCGPNVSARCQSEVIFVSVPRWATGVPATLNMVVHNSTGHAVLRPWPSRTMQNTSNCSNIQNVQSMEIDPDGVMWVVDVGRKDFAQPDRMDNSCPPKMVLIDVPSGEVLDTYTFPSDVAPYNGSFLNDIVLDIPNQMGYISSTGNSPSDLGAIVVYDRANKKSGRFEDHTTRAEEGAQLVIHSTDYSTLMSGFPTDGIAFAPSEDRLYYCPLGGFHLYSLDAQKLRALVRDVNSTTASVSATVIDHGSKPSNPDGMTFGKNGELFFGGITTDSLYKWAPGSGAVHDQSVVIATDPAKLWWIDTFAWDNAGNLWLTSNKLNTWLFGAEVPPSMDFTGASGANFRIIKVALGIKSYMSSP